MSRIEPRNYAEAIQAGLEKYVPEEKLLQGGLFQAMRYSLLLGGKRIRPILLLEFCGACGGDQESAIPFACALEMIHTYSLIHDDLPCMDDDSMRRGKPSNHVVFGEARALLAGDALLTMAFETMLSQDSIASVGPQRAARAAGILARASGAYGMAGGQMIDLQSEDQKIPADTLIYMDECKTGTLIVAAAKMGCVLADAEEEKLHAAEKYAKSIGLAFQIQDDILDVEGEQDSLGKPIGSDLENGKSTYVSILGMEKARALVQSLTDEATAALSCFGARGDYLRELAIALSSRKN
ncbi:Farnesyl diphosphate synthase [Caprobacter fermentans]|uniref:Farnesyl diphosphate synthase n=1 Tax=Caproicibacter fermentans TaxID=2576756 RepID=A0A6N8I4M3_9FIRM|nr:farnesyl diphosphate synthase [Caproicibacter fermentans]MVB12982.1 Farnesyl diphosphate synthase [Caproicibacter fermentans]OCN02483.1 geranyl transferase [Clostridium sp. W14A]